MLKGEIERKSDEGREEKAMIKKFEGDTEEKRDEVEEVLMKMKEK